MSIFRRYHILILSWNQTPSKIVMIFDRIWPFFDRAILNWPLSAKQRIFMVYDFFKFRQKILNEPNDSTTQDASCRRCVIKLHFRQDPKRPDFNKIQKLFNSSDKKSRQIEQKIMVFLLTFKLELPVTLFICIIYIHACPSYAPRNWRKTSLGPESKKSGVERINNFGFG